MRRLFFNIMLSIVISICVVAGLAFAFLEYTNHARYSAHLRSQLSPTATLLRLGVERQRPQQLEQWLDIVSGIMQIELDIEQKSDQTSVVVDSDKSGQFILTAPISQNRHIDLKLDGLNESLISATAFLILNELGVHPAKQRQAIFDRIRASAPYPIYRSLKVKDRLNDKQLERLRNGEIVIEWKKVYDKGDQIYAYAPWGRSGHILVLGPIPLFEPYPIEIILATFAFSFLLITACVLLIVSLLTSRLTRVKHSIDDISSEKLGLENLEQHSDDPIEDITQKIRWLGNRVQALLQERTYTVRAISHDLRTPISKLHFRVDTLADMLPEEGKLINDLKQDLFSINHLIEQLLTFEQAEDRLNFASIDIDDLCRELIEEYRLISPNVEFSYQARPGCPYTINGNRALIKRSFENIIQNGIRHCSQRFWIQLDYHSDELICRFCDDGQGISEVSLPQLFDPFYRGDSSRSGSGTGIGFGFGLAIVKRVTKQHDGSVSARNASNGGAIFELEFPLLRPTAITEAI
ncbi:sensor histidine kinase [Pseudoteredinibacter isoporae]|uniref:histidine kinase n=1 Tax=Pseudoteredinibacter isoporae TaxID=570281 RepID=A0A7X0MVN5_9GAMM|nr:HAMP domain-containing sensor histidine kinase [Pseudoteredinibacter isoporae]MBB6520039.1 two-component system sensor histidine kinase RstB [Pseudoteredinibacter isoporae]NHO85611.1 HAMP domain-containing histidine kinase [Pseudoteredinibacter isoporae]NIB25937.1 HAMP domain-containing histidine kinase [Pseudoteredinibacter isoporae]